MNCLVLGNDVSGGANKSSHRLDTKTFVPLLVYFPYGINNQQWRCQPHAAQYTVAFFVHDAVTKHRSLATPTGGAQTKELS